jgi:hypothetical protein
MAVATSPIIPKDGTLTIADGTGSPITWTAVYEDGDFSISDLEEGDYETELFYDRHEPYSMRKVKRKVYEWSFTCHLVAFTDSAGNALDVVRFAGAFASAISTGGASNAKGDAKLLQLTWATERSDYGGTGDGSWVMKYNRLKASIAEGVPTKITITGMSIPFSTDYMTIT